MSDSTNPPGPLAGVKGTTRIEDPSPAQRTIARRSAESRATVPDLELSADVDMAAAVELRAETGYAGTALLVRACALALRETPRANGAYRDGRFELYSRVNIGVTLGTADAYAVPAVLDADQKSLAELSAELDDLAVRASAGELTPPELSGATFTLTDLGAYEIARAAPSRRARRRRRARATCGPGRGAHDRARPLADPGRRPSDPVRVAGGGVPRADQVAARARIAGARLVGYTFSRCKTPMSCARPSGVSTPTGKPTRSKPRLSISNT
jgi:hypothetical protein